MRARELQLPQLDWMQVLPQQISLRVLQLQTLQGHACFLLSVHPDANKRVFVALIFRRDWCRFAHFCGLWSATYLAQLHALQIQTCAWRRGRPSERTYDLLAQGEGLPKLWIRTAPIDHVAVSSGNSVLVSAVCVSGGYRFCDRRLTLQIHSQLGLCKPRLSAGYLPWLCCCC